MAAKKDVVYLSLYLDTAKAEKAYKTLITLQGQLEEKLSEARKKAIAGKVDPKEDPTVKMIEKQLKDVKSVSRQFNATNREIAKAATDMSQMATSAINSLIRNVEKRLDGLKGKARESAKANELREILAQLRRERETRGLSAGYGLSLGGLEKELANTPKSIEALKKLREQFVAFRNYTTNAGSRDAANNYIRQLDADIRQMETAPLRDLTTILANIGNANNGSIEKLKSFREELVRLQQTSSNKADVLAASQAIAELDKRIAGMTKVTMSASQAETQYISAQNALKAGVQGRADKVRELIASMKQAQQAEGISIQQSQKYAAMEKELTNMLNNQAHTFMTAAQAHSAYNTAKNILAQGENASAQAVRNSIEAMKQAQQAQGTSVENNRLYVEMQKKLEQQLNNTAQSYMHLRQVRQVIDQGDGARVTSINQAIQSLQRLSQSEGTTAEQAKKYASMMNVLRERLKGASAASQELAYDQNFVKQTLNNVKTAPINDLEKAIRMLEMEINNSSRSMKDFTQKQRDLKTMKEEVSRLKGEVSATSHSFQQQGDWITKATTKLLNYIGIFGGFYLVRQKLTEAFQANLKYDDSLTNIRKTTGLTAEAVEMLADNIKRIDTRTSLDEITNLAYAAGKLGVKGVSDVMAFTRAANQINIALGEQLNGAESVEQIMKITELMGQNKELGIEQALLKTGSAINHLTMNSQAVAQPMVDFMRRTAGIATQAGITTSELTGLAGAVNALGQNVEMSATSVSKMIVQMEKKPDGVVKALQMSGEEAQHFKDLLSIGDAMDAFLIVLKKTRELGGLAALAPIVKDLGSEGQRVIQTIATLSSNYEKVEDMVRKSNEAFEEGISVTREYNIKNENTAALWERLKNSFSKMMVSPEAVRYIREILLDLQEMPAYVEQFVRSFQPLASMLKWILEKAVALRSLVTGFAYAVFFRTIITGIASIGLGITNVVTGIISGVKGMLSLNAATIRTNLSFKSFFTFLKSAQFSNIFTAILGVAASIATTIWQAHQEAKRFTEELEEGLRRSRAEALAETRAIDELDSRLKAAGENTEEYKNIIQEINEKYGTLLNNILDEASSYDEVARALKAVNSELRMKALMDAKQKALTDQTQTNFEQQAKLEDKLEESIVAILKRMKDKVEVIKDENGEEVESYTFAELYEKDDASAKNIVSNVMKGLMSVNESTGKAKISEFVEGGNLGSSIMGYLQGMGFTTKLVTSNNDDFIGLFRNAKNLNNKIVENENKIDQINNRYNRVIEREAGGALSFYDKGASDTWSPISANVTQNGALQSFAGLQKEEIEAYKVVWAREREGMKKQERLDKIEEVKAYLNWAEEDVATKRAADIGKNESANRADWTDVYRTAYDQKQLAEAYLKIISNKQAEVTVDDKEKKKEARQAQDDYKNIIQKIKDFYELQTTELRQQRIDREITESAYQRALEQMKINENNALAAARFRIVGDSSAESWGAAKTAMAGQNIVRNTVDEKGNTINAGAQAMARIEKTGDVRSIGTRLAAVANTDDTYSISAIRKNANKEIMDAAETARKQAEEISKAWLERNPMGKLSKQYQEEFEKLGLMLVDLKKTATMSLDEMADLTMQAYLQVGRGASKFNITTKEGLEQFRESMMQTGILFTGAVNADDETLRQVYYKSYEYADQYREQLQRLTDRTMKIWNKMFDVSESHVAAEQMQKDLEAIVNAYSMAEKYGGSGRLKLEAVRDAKQVKVADETVRYQDLAANAYADKASADAFMQTAQKSGDANMIEQARGKVDEAQAEIDALPEKYQAVTAAIQELADAEFALKEATFEWVESMEGAFERFMDGFVPFRSWYENNGSFAANIFGTKSERQEAFGAFMDDLKKTVRNSIMEYTKMRVQKSVQDKIEQIAKRKGLIQETTLEKTKRQESMLFNLAADKMEMNSDQIKTTTEEANSTKATATEIQNKSTETSATVMGNWAQAVSKAFAQLGPIAGAVAAGVVSAAIGAVLTMAMNALGGGKKSSTATTPKTKLVSGMLTYDRGNVQSWSVRTFDAGNAVEYVQGDNGVYYAVQSRDIMTRAPHGLVTRPTLTTIGGAPALVAENGPEMVIGRETTRAMMMNNPALFRAILAYDRNHSAGFAKTFDSGNTQSFSSEQIDSMSQEEMKQIILGNQAALAQSASVNAALVEQLSRGIHASFNVHGSGGALDAISQGMAEERRRGNNRYSKLLVGG